MLFLKQIRAKGFKSFADETILDFNHDMTGVVGPNGSGKSNITDAIRWTLAEQSNKSLRGSNGEDMIFSGSVEKKAAEFAEVTLVFNNVKDMFSTYDTDTVEVCRRYVKKTHENEYFINGQKVKTRDIQDIALETGLTKSSIAIISQGNVSEFASAKPEARREIFDEAAGVAKYKKRKKETVNKLTKAKENLDRTNDIFQEIARRLPGLEKQASRAQTYESKIKTLQEIELAIIRTDLITLDERSKVLEDQKFELDKKIKSLSSEINLTQDEANSILNEARISEREITNLNNKFQEIVQRIANLKNKKVEIEAREESKIDTSNLDQIKASQIKKQFDEKRILINAEKDKVHANKTTLVEMKERYDYITNQYQTTYDELTTITRNLQKLEFDKQQLENHRGFGANANMRAPELVVQNKGKLPGVIGTIMQLSKVDPQYHIAISSVAAGGFNSVVIKQNSDVKKVIDFLKQQNSGKATFLPLDTLQPSTITGAQRDAIAAAPGFVGIASEVVEINPEYQKALDYVLGTIIIVDNYDSAIKLSRNINYRFNIVTLDGQRILPKGAIVAGNMKNQNIFADQSKSVNSIEELDRRIAATESAEKERTLKLNEFKNSRDKSRDQISDLTSQINSSETNIDLWTASINELNDDYKVVTGKSLIGGNNQVDDSNESESLKLAREIARLENERNEIQIKIATLQANRNSDVDRQQEISKANKEKYTQLDEFKSSAADIRAELSVIQQKLIAMTMRLAEGYNMSADDLKAADIKPIEDEVATRKLFIEISQELKSIGPINMDSIEEYKQEKERHDYYEAQISDIRESVEQLEKIIFDIDVAMETQFKKIVDDVNAALPEAFIKLFGGGTAKLIYTDPENILETGIDIQVNPPGKKIMNLNLLSGGEKSLVALSVLFSILKVRPLPLVILDEVEAPLDIANVERFARYVRDFTQNSQFIIVTHREGTMENCDVLFGVTMQTKGITKVVKVKLQDAKELVDGPNQ
ncbi:AAA family ATPase [Mesoplasma photuris]|uniref:AAA family ATPase n=1 Tax=Mesoplasma photuris TaxID=217731 RepID=UPI0004E11850|nr:AAA family ATPase [Mesoplasma photuris]